MRANVQHKLMILKFPIVKPSTYISIIRLLRFLERPWEWCCIKTPNGISSGKISRTTTWSSIVSVPKTKESHVIFPLLILAVLDPMPSVQLVST